MSELKNRYDFVLLFDVQDGNPNGDPDAGNMPRTDPESGHGLVTDVCLKRKVRNFIQLTKAGEPGFDIFIKEKAVLNSMIQEACEKTKDAKNPVEGARLWMCKKYFDIRAFGAVLSTGTDSGSGDDANPEADSEADTKKKSKEKKPQRKNAGQVRGPIQMTFARSIDPVMFQEHTITRMAVTNEKDENKERTMGQKFTVPYGLYIAHGFVSPQLATQSGFSQEDLDFFFSTLARMFEFDHSAARGMMSARRLIVFKHDDALGSAPAWKLFDLVHVARKANVEYPRSYSDYQVSVEDGALPSGVTIEKKYDV